MGPFEKISKKPIESLINNVPKFHVELLTKAFMPVVPDQREFRVDCRILMVMPGGQDRYHFHKQTVNLFTVVEGEIDVILNDNQIHLTHGQSVLVDVLDKHAFVACADKPCILTETRLNVYDQDVFYCDEQEPQGRSTTRFSSQP
jgi:mannose-6-phosphate isomerase-like protein (cupin superfamily)